MTMAKTTTKSTRPTAKTAVKATAKKAVKATAKKAVKATAKKAVKATAKKAVKATAKKAVKATAKKAVKATAKKAARATAKKAVKATAKKAVKATAKNAARATAKKSAKATAKKAAKASKATSRWPTLPPGERVSGAEARAWVESRGVSTKNWWTTEATQEVLVCRGDVRVAAIRLDFQALAPAVGIVVDGDLTVELLQNGEMDFGPFLIVLGDLTVRNAAIAGSDLRVRGTCRVTCCFHGYYNHGSTVLMGPAEGLFVADDYNLRCEGPVRGTVLSVGGHVTGTTVSTDLGLLDASLLGDEDTASGLASGRLYERLVAGDDVRARKP